MNRYFYVERQPGEWFLSCLRPTKGWRHSRADWKDILRARRRGEKVVSYLDLLSLNRRRR